ncbi:MAG: hypothetical protein HN837_10190 [Chloroflexi bacterium]|jgi:hypothetical protein|nr:hypothetical protein [Chloroflexota bacterium]
MDINVTKLSKELKAANISTHGNCNSNGVVWDDLNKEIQNRDDVQNIIKNHDPVDSKERFNGKSPKDLTEDERNEILFMLDKDGKLI